MKSLSKNPIETLIECGKQFYERKWMWGSSGNLSVKTGDKPLQFLITPSGASKGYLKREQLLTIANGRPVKSRRDASALIPSSETVIHQKVYDALPGAGAVFHVHPIFSTLISKLYGDPNHLKMLDVGWFEPMRGVGVGDEEKAEIAIFPNWKEVERIGNDIVHYIKNARQVVPAVLVYNHGLTGWGRTPEETRKNLEIIEYVCEYLYWKRLADPATSLARG